VLFAMIFLFFFLPEHRAFAFHRTMRPWHSIDHFRLVGEKLGGFCYAFPPLLPKSVCAYFLVKEGFCRRNWHNLEAVISNKDTFSNQSLNSGIWALKQQGEEVKNIKFGNLGPAERIKDKKTMRRKIRRQWDGKIDEQNVW
jgi:hypothetical protein